MGAIKTINFPLVEEEHKEAKEVKDKMKISSWPKFFMRLVRHQKEDLE